MLDLIQQKIIDKKQLTDLLFQTKDQRNFSQFSDLSDLSDLSTLRDKSKSYS